MEKAFAELKKNSGDKALSDAWWQRFKRGYIRVFGCNKKRRPIRLHHTKLQLSFQDDEPTNASDFATLRMACEFHALKKFGGITLERFWEIENPPLSLVNYCHRRWNAYQSARVKAHQHLKKVVWQMNLKDVCSPAEARDLQIQFGNRITENRRQLAATLSAQEKALLDRPDRMAEFLAGDFWDLADTDREVFLRRTHCRSRLFQTHYRDAMRYAAGLISKSELHLIMLHIFPRLSLDEKILFVRLCASRPKAQKQNRLKLLCAWLQDNAPVFSEFGWHWEAVHAETMNTLGEKHLPKSATLLKEYCTRPTGKPRVQLGLGTAPIGKRHGHFARPHAELLTPIPALTLR